MKRTLKRVLFVFVVYSNGVYMTIEALAWKNMINDQHTYVMQFCSGSSKEHKNIVESLDGWIQTGSGTNKKGEEVLIFKKDFKDTLSWIEWTKKSPFIINEVDKVGSPKKLKTQVVLVDDGRRKCGICFKSGHNKQTCPENKEKIIVPVKVGKNICSQCSGIGHNKRTCTVKPI